MSYRMHLTQGDLIWLLLNVRLSTIGLTAITTERSSNWIRWRMLKKRQTNKHVGGYSSWRDVSRTTGVKANAVMNCNVQRSPRTATFCARALTRPTARCLCQVHKGQLLPPNCGDTGYDAVCCNALNKWFRSSMPTPPQINSNKLWQILVNCLVCQQNAMTTAAKDQTYYASSY